MYKGTYYKSFKNVDFEQLFVYQFDNQDEKDKLLVR